MPPAEQPPLSLSLLPPDSPLRQAAETYLTRAGFPGTLDEALTENAPQDIQETIRTASRYLALGEQGTAPRNGKMENYLLWMLHPHISDVVQSERETHAEPLDREDIVHVASRGGSHRRSLVAVQLAVGQLEKATTPGNSLVAWAQNRLRTVMGDKKEQEDAERRELLAKLPPVGHVMFDIRKDCIALITLGVKSDARGSGTTETLLARVMSEQLRADGHPKPLVDTRQDILAPTVRSVGDLHTLLDKIHCAETPLERTKWLLRLQRSRLSDFQNNRCHAQLQRMLQPLLRGDEAFHHSENGRRCFDGIHETLQTFYQITDDLSVLDYRGNPGSKESQEPSIELSRMAPDERPRVRQFVPAIGNTPRGRVGDSEIWIKASLSGETIGIAAYEPMTVNGKRALILRRFCIAPECKQCGAAAELAVELLCELPKTGCDRLVLPKAISDERAKAEAKSVWRPHNKPH